MSYGNVGWEKCIVFFWFFLVWDGVAGILVGREGYHCSFVLPAGGLRVRYQISIINK